MENIASSKHLKILAAIILLSLMIVTVFSIASLYNQYEANGVGALIELQNEKYRKEQASPENLEVRPVKCDGDGHCKTNQSILCTAKLDVQQLS